ncbi:MAG: YceI family protein, partial [Salinisphaeraceae bacterium]|nr:YceI family protein [Salinisphaeraceae bacterium]
ILALSLFRLVWRWLNRPPPFPDHMQTWERVAAKATHWLFYVLMIGIPLTGWLYVSTQWHGDRALNVPTVWFGLITIPHLFSLNQLPDELRQQWSEELGETHEFMAYAMLVLLALHVAAALKHQFVNRDETLGQMLPVLSPKPNTRGRRLLLWLGGILIVTGIIAAVSNIFSVPQTDTQRGDNAITSTGQWVIDPTASEIAFAGQHAGRDFRGRFSSWHAQLDLDAEQPQQSNIVVEVKTATGKTGSKLHNKSLPEAEWFDVANYPEAVFKLIGIEPQGENSYAAYGTLSIKDKRIELPPFTLRLSNERAEFKGKAVIDRADVDIGMESDPRGEWVSRQITIQVDAVAYPKD